MRVKETSAQRHAPPICAWYCSGASRAFDLGGVGELDLVEPTAGVRFAVYQGRVRDDGLVGLGNLPADRRVDVVGRLDRLDHSAGVAGFDLPADLGQLDEHHVRQLVLRMVGDADRRDVARHPHPFVRLRVFQIQRNVSHKAN